MIKGKAITFMRSLKHPIERHFILNFNCKNKEEAKKLAGKTVIWKSPAGKIIEGKISSSHGNKGLVRAIFERGLPGQAMNTDVEIK
jgi:large subunit ribosomal protein L35Ae